jgi:hypothetical protein
VKYAFLPLAAGLFIALLFDWRFASQHKVQLIHQHHAKNMPYHSLLYVVPLLVGVGLFSERYIGNVVSYHTPIPECNEVLSVAECQQYAPWARNYMFDSWNLPLEHGDTARYPFTWIHKALGETVFAITSRFNDRGVVDYYNVNQLLVPNILSWIVLIGGGALSVFYWRSIKRNQALWVLLGVSALYILVLFAQNLLDFLHLGVPIAIHGRYLFPVLPLLFLVVALAASRLCERFKLSKSILAISVLVIFALEGGGFVTLIVRSHDDWFWPQSRPAQLANQYARDVLQYVVVD